MIETVGKGNIYAVQLEEVPHCHIVYMLHLDALMLHIRAARYGKKIYLSIYFQVLLQWKLSSIQGQKGNNIGNDIGNDMGNDMDDMGKDIGNMENNMNGIPLLPMVISRDIVEICDGDLVQSDNLIMIW